MVLSTDRSQIIRKVQDTAVWIQVFELRLKTSLQSPNPKVRIRSVGNLVFEDRSCGAPAAKALKSPAVATLTDASTAGYILAPQETRNDVTTVTSLVLARPSGRSLLETKNIFTGTLEGEMTADAIDSKPFPTTPLKTPPRLEV